MSEHSAALPHGALDEIFPHIFFVTGTFRSVFNGTPLEFSRNMTVVRDGDALTLINTVRLNDEGLAHLDALGTVRHVVTLGAFHGIDDPFYLERYGATQWALPQHKHKGGHATDQALMVDGPMPFEGVSLFVFETSQRPEALLHIHREGGILVSCDSLQNWVELDEYFDDSGARIMTDRGFIKPANLGLGWLRAAQPQVSDFSRLLTLEFQHLLPAHGTPLRNEAKPQFRATIEAQFAP
ncbi:MAG: hypothetical protein AAGF11_09040 [Myxococcota bacterium]